MAIPVLSWWNSNRMSGRARGPAVQSGADAPSPATSSTTLESWPHMTDQPSPSVAPPAVDSLVEQVGDATTTIATAGRDKLHVRFTSEQTDAGWSLATEQALARMSTSPQIEELGAKPLSFNARCRTTICVIHADFPTRRTAEDWFTLYTLNSGAQMSNVSVQTLTNPNGSIRLELYGFARPAAP
jgi:hypothetical protein